MVGKGETATGFSNSKHTTHQGGEALNEELAISGPDGIEFKGA